MTREGKKDNTNKSFWEKFAKIYTAFMARNQSTYKRLSEYLCGYLDEEKRVLELACGTGQMTFLSAEHCNLWEATDYSPQMVAEAKKRNDEKYKLKQVNFRVQDATRLTYEDNSFDVVVIANALHIMPNPDKALLEIYRVLKPDGILFAPTFVYEKGHAKVLIRIMEKAGFVTYHKWNKTEYEMFVKKCGFSIRKSVLEKGKQLHECMLVAEKRDIAEDVK